MKDNLEKYIDANRTDFDKAVPPLEIWGNIDQAVNKGKIKRLSVIRILSIAASVLLLALFGAGMYHAGQTQVKEVTLADISPEYEGMEAYYSRQIKNMQAQLVSFEDKKAVDEDLEQLDTVMKELKAELQHVPKGSEARIVHEMIKNYQLRIELLERVLERINSTNTKPFNSEKNETINI